MAETQQKLAMQKLRAQSLETKKINLDLRNT